MVVSQPRSHVGGVAVRHVYSYFMTCSAGLGYFVKSPGWLRYHLITKLILVAFKLRCQDLDKAIVEPRAMERIVFKVPTLYPDSDSSKEMQH